jgi:hypothetical protein
VELPNEHGDWQEVQVSLSSFLKADKIPDDIKTDLSQSNGSQGQTEKEELTEENDPTRSNKLSITRWKSEGSLTIENVILLNDKGEESTVFQVGCSMTVLVTFQAHQDNVFNIFPSLAVYRRDSVLITKFICERHFTTRMHEGDRRTLRLDTEPLKLGNGIYVFSIALFQTEIDESQRYDLLDRSFEFEIVGNSPVMAGVVVHLSGKWKPEEQLTTY